MPGWLTAICVIATVVACAYLLCVILYPERF